MKLVPKNWSDFQHYKDRAPPWIKLHKGLLDDSAFQRLPTASRALAPMLWLLASEQKDGSFDADHAELAFRLRQTEKEIKDALIPLISKGFFLLVQDASTPLAQCKPDAIPETEERQRTEVEKEKEKSAKAPTYPKPEDVDSQIWQDWKDLRKKKRATVSDTVVKGARGQAAIAGMSLNDFLAVWCRRGSQGLEAAWLKPDERRTLQSRHSAGAAAIFDGATHV